MLGAAGIVLFSVLAPLQAVAYGTFLPLAMVLGAAACAAPAVAHRYPRTAIALFSPAAFLLALATATEAGPPAVPWPWSVPGMIAFTLLVLVLAARHGWRVASLAWAVSNIGSLVVLLALPDAAAGGVTAANLIVTASISATALLVGVLLAGRIRVGEELTQSIALTEREQSRRVVVEERTRIARELHDVVAHSMSVVQVQASTARYRLPDLSPDAVAEFDGIATAARASLAEMRRLLGVLRTEDSGPEFAPQQGIRDIPELVETVRRAGVDVDLSLTEADAPPPSVQITAFRIVQEALSNAVRHAPGAAVQIEVRAEPGEVVLHVRNGRRAERPGASVPAQSGHHGLQGMQERVALLAGSLIVGPDSEGGWTVRAVLPWTADGEART